jgi:hypothetical protein
VQLLRPDRDYPLRKRLWQAGVALALIMLVIAGHEVQARRGEASHQLSLGEDFLPVYAAGKLMRDGRGRELYAIAPLAAIERQIVRDADLAPLPLYGPFLNPPFFAVLYVPFSTLEYRHALGVWILLNCLLLTGSLLLLCRLLPAGTDWQTWALAPLLGVLSMPLWMAAIYQQNTFLSLFLLCVVVHLWRSDRGRWTPFAAGLVCGFLFYKPQLAVVVAVALVVTRGRGALLGLVTTGSILALLTMWRMPGTLTMYVRAMPAAVHSMQTVLRYNWGLQATPQSFWRLLIQGRAVGATGLAARLLSGLTTATFGSFLAMALYRFTRTGKPQHHLDRIIAATIAVAPLLMPYYMTYDLLLLAIPAVLLACDRLKSAEPLSIIDRLLPIAWAMLYVELYMNPGLANRTRVNIAVPLLGCVAGLTIARCLAHRVAAQPGRRYDASMLATAA